MMHYCQLIIFDVRVMYSTISYWVLYDKNGEVEFKGSYYQYSYYMLPIPNQMGMWEDEGNPSIKK